MATTRYFRVTASLRRPRLGHGLPLTTVTRHLKLDHKSKTHTVAVIELVVKQFYELAPSCTSDDWVLDIYTVDEATFNDEVKHEP